MVMLPPANDRDKRSATRPPREEPRVPTETHPQADFRRRSAIATLWAGVRSAWGAGASFLLFVLMARLLSPADFGLYGLALMGTDIARVLATVGIVELVVRDRDADPTLAATAFWTILAVTAGVMVLLYAGAPFYAQLVRAPELVPLLRVLTLAVPLTTLPALPLGLLTRELRHKQIAMLTMIATLAGGVTAVVMALRGYGVWSLAGQFIVQGAITTVLAFAAHPWRPTGRPDRRHLPAIAHFAVSLTGTNLLWIVGARLQEALLSRYQGVEVTGMFRVAARLLDILSQTFVQPLVGVALVTFSHARERADLHSRLVGAVRAAALLSVPLTAGVAATAPVLVPALFGDTWRGAVPLLQILWALSIPGALTAFFNPAMTSVNRPGLVFGFTLVQTPLILIAVWIAAQHSPAAVAAAIVVMNWLTAAAQMPVLRRFMGMGAGTVLQALGLPAVAATAMAVVVGVGMRQPLAQALHPFPTLVAATAVGIALFAVFLRLLGQNPVAEIRMLLSVLRTRTPAA